MEPVTHPTTDYFRNEVLSKRPYIRMEWCVSALFRPIELKFNQKTAGFGTGFMSQNWADGCEASRSLTARLCTTRSLT